MTPGLPHTVAPVTKELWMLFFRKPKRKRNLSLSFIQVWITILRVEKNSFFLEQYTIPPNARPLFDLYLYIASGKIFTRP
jgi:hypothetical protein